MIVIATIDHGVSDDIFDVCMKEAPAPGPSRSHIHPDVTVKWVSDYLVYEVVCACCNRCWYVQEKLFEQHSEKVIDSTDWTGRPIGHMELSLPLLKTLGAFQKGYGEDPEDDDPDLD